MRRLLPLLLVLAPAAAAQDLLVLRFQPARVSLFDGATGALLQDTFIDIDALVGLNGWSNLLLDLSYPGNGELWVTNYTAEEVLRFTADGGTYLGTVPVAPGRALGIEVIDGTAWIAAEDGPSGAGINRIDVATGSLLGFTPQTGCYDLIEFGGELLVSTSAGRIYRIDQQTGAIVGTFVSNSFLFFDQMSIALNGNLLVAKFFGDGFREYDSLGNIVQNVSTLGLPSGIVRGVAELQNGDYLLTSPSGLFLYDPGAGVTQIDAISSGYVLPYRAGEIGTPYCGPSQPNSTGQVGVIRAYGSDAAADNALSLVATGLPDGESAYFLGGLTQGFVPFAGGSQGVLCLWGGVRSRSKTTAFPLREGGGFAATPYTTPATQLKDTASG